MSTHDRFEDVFGTRRGTGERPYHRDIAVARGRLMEATGSLDEGQAVAVALSKAFGRLEAGHAVSTHEPCVTLMPSEEPRNHCYQHSVTELLKKGNRETWFAVLACAANIRAFDVKLPLARSFDISPLDPECVADQVAYLMTEDWPQIETLLKEKS